MTSEELLFKEGNKICAFDFDSPIFAAASILETSEIIVTHKPSGRKKTYKNVTSFYGRDKAKSGGWLGGINNNRISKGLQPFPLEDFEIEKNTYISEPDENGHKTIAKKIKDIKSQPWVKELKIIIDGEGNFRKDVAFSMPYKGTRSPKPLRWKAMREWFEKTYEGQYVIEVDQEADDAVAILGWWGWKQYKKTGINPIVMCHIDKDIDQVPGWHINYDTGKIKWIDEIEACRNLWAQVLQGDKTDDIPGLPGATKEVKERFGLKKDQIGPVGAKSIIANCETEQEMIDNVFWCFKSWFIENPYKCKDGEEIPWESMVNEQFMLVRLLSKRMTFEDIEQYAKERGLNIYETI